MPVGDDDIILIVKLDFVGLTEADLASPASKTAVTNAIADSLNLPRSSAHITAMKTIVVELARRRRLLKYLSGRRQLLSTVTMLEITVEIRLNRAQASRISEALSTDAVVSGISSKTASNLETATGKTFPSLSATVQGIESTVATTAAPSITTGAPTTMMPLTTTAGPAAGGCPFLGTAGNPCRSDACKSDAKSAACQEVGRNFCLQFKDKSVAEMIAMEPACIALVPSASSTSTTTGRPDTKCPFKATANNPCSTIACKVAGGASTEACKAVVYAFCDAFKDLPVAELAAIEPACLSFGAPLSSPETSTTTKG